jgi:ribosomal protein L37AE/L43A
MFRRAFVDDQLLAREFHTGDFVRHSDLHDLLLSPYAGRVLYSNPDTGKVSVQWPWGAEQDSPSQLVRLNMELLEFFPPMLIDQSYSSWEGARNIDDKQTLKEDDKWRKSLASRVASRFEEATGPIWRSACKAWRQGKNEIQAFTSLHSIFGDQFGTDTVRLTVSNLYEHSRRLSIYYKNNKRKYKVTQKEKNSGDLKCPRCRTPGSIKPRVYRQGKRVLQCRNCGFSIHPGDLVK